MLNDNIFLMVVKRNAFVYAHFVKSLSDKITFLIAPRAVELYQIIFIAHHISRILRIMKFKLSLKALRSYLFYSKHGFEN